MRLHGYCSSCRRMRLVRVSGHALALAHSLGGVPSGICDECEREEDEKRKRARR